MHFCSNANTNQQEKNYKINKKVPGRGNNKNINRIRESGVEKQK